MPLATQGRLTPPEGESMGQKPGSHHHMAQLLLVHTKGT